MKISSDKISPPGVTRSILSAEASPVRKRVSQQLSVVREKDLLEKIQDCGLNISGQSEKLALITSLLKMSAESLNGKVSFRRAWRLLATRFPDWRSRLIITACLISEGAISILPTPTARDWRSPGDPAHPRLNGSRGLPLPEDLGSQVHPELLESLMGFPIGWTELKH